MSGRFHTKVRKAQRHLDKQQWIRRRLNGRNYLGKRKLHCIQPPGGSSDASALNTDTYQLHQQALGHCSCGKTAFKGQKP